MDEKQPANPNIKPDIDWKALSGPTNPFAVFAGPRTLASREDVPTLDPREIERDGVYAVCIETFWKGDLLSVEYVSEGDRRDIGPRDRSEEAVGYVELKQGQATVALAGTARGRVFSRSSNKVDDVIAGSSIDLGTVERLEVHGPALTHRISMTKAGKQTPRAMFPRGDRSVPTYFALSLFAHAAFVGALAAFVPPLGMLEDESSDKDRMYLLQQYLDSSAEREKQQETSPDDGAAESTDGAPSAPAAAGPSGTVGHPEVTKAQGRLAVAADVEAPSRQLSRDAMIDAAQNFGLIGLLSSIQAGPSSPFASTAAGDDAQSAFGDLFSDTIGDRTGTGGLALSGAGLGGGYRGDTIGVNMMGTCKEPPCGVGGWGHHPGRGLAERATKAPPRMRIAEVNVSGTLPATVIQRIVRQNFGRFRQCYEMGLAQNPSLEGRVTARFVIDRDGSVSTVQSGGSDLPSADVVGCVLRAYRALSFPAPENGIVTVTYPIVFAPS